MYYNRKNNNKKTEHYLWWLLWSLCLWNGKVALKKWMDVWLEVATKSRVLTRKYGPFWSQLYWTTSSLQFSTWNCIELTLNTRILFDNSQERLSRIRWGLCEGLKKKAFWMLQTMSKSWNTLRSRQLLIFKYPSRDHLRCHRQLVTGSSSHSGTGIFIPQSTLTECCGLHYCSWNKMSQLLSLCITAAKRHCGWLLSN